MFVYDLSGMFSTRVLRVNSLDMTIGKQSMHDWYYFVHYIEMLGWFHSGVTPTTHVTS